MSENFILSKKLISIKISDVIHHPVYEKFFPSFNKLNNTFELYTEQFINNYVKLNPPTIVESDSHNNHFICIYNILSYFLANNFYSNDTKISCLKIEEISLKDQENLILDLIINDILQFFPLINKFCFSEYYQFILALFESTIDKKSLSIAKDTSDVNKIYKSFDILKNNLNIENNYKKLFKTIFPITENTLKNNTSFSGLRPRNKKNVQKRDKGEKSFFIFEFNKKIEIELTALENEIKLIYKYQNETKDLKLHKNDIIPYKELLFFEEQYIIIPNVKLLYLKKKDKYEHSRLYIYNIDSKKFLIVNYISKKVSFFDFQDSKKFKFYDKEALLEKHSDNKYLFKIDEQETIDVPVINYLLLPVNNTLIDKIKNIFLNEN